MTGPSTFVIPWRKEYFFRRQPREMSARLGYVPALDGLRALAVGLTILYHAEAPHAWGGYLGVDIFFVLSGFLITTLLLEEMRDTGTVSLKNFYARRALRLCPALLLMLAVDAAALPLYHNGTGWNFGKEAAVAALYLSDYAISLGLMPILTLVTHTWSLAVEEHFYILWPLALLWLRRRYLGQALLPVLGAGWFLATVWKLACISAAHQAWETVYFRFDTHMSGLLLGAFLSAFLFEGGKIRGLSWGLPVSAVLLLGCITSMTQQAAVSDFSIYATVAAEIFTFFIIARIMAGEAHPVVRCLSWRPVVMIGKISYGLYLFHYAAAYYMWPGHKWERTFAVSAVAAGILATLSYFTVERVARKLRTRFGRG